MKTFFGVIILFFVIFICSCSGKTQRSRKPVSTIEFLSSPKNYVIGQPLTFKTCTKLKDGKLRRVQAFLNNKLLVSSSQAEFKYTVTALSEIGVNTLRIVAEKTDGVTNSRSEDFTVLSDIVPVKYSYAVVREYNHSTDHFTQGLQFLNGFLYEGTGENGKSALFKINLSDNKILMKRTLSEKYFGEGITIFHNKIYQLTYKNQTGFVYNLSDFSPVDSFKFSSQEGWGLTNDGKSLIMSDGTSNLTWLNPENYAVEKIIQPTDNQKVFQNLNELEYDNGSIWANLWTSNQIIKIDASTGKVLGYLDLNGILGMMPSSQAEKIDVLNGIALLPSGNILITGKLWPKMFEIKINKSK